MNIIELNKTYSLDLGSSAPVEIKTISFTNEGVKCEYLNSWAGRIEVLGYDLFEMNGYSKENETKIDNYVVTHIGDGKFQVKLENGDVKEAGKNLCGMIRYTYFEDYTMPEIGWSVTRKQLISDYIPKVQQDLLNGKLELQ